MVPESLTRPKVLMEVGGRVLLDYVIDFWVDRVTEFILVVGYKKELVYQYAENRGLNCRFVEQKELKGIAHALSLCDDLIEDRHVLQLGDCLARGKFLFHRGMSCGVGVWQTEHEKDILRSYSVEIEGEMITRVVEKPRKAPNNLCGMGTYFLDRNIFNAIRNTPPSALRGECEITDALQTLIDSGYSLYPVTFHGDYINVTYSEDLGRAKEIFL